MKLNRLTPANVHKIRKPMWNGRRVGIATYKIATHNLIEILAKAKNGEYMYSVDGGKTPATYYASAEQLNSADSMQLAGGVVLRVIPIAELDLFEGRHDA